MADEVVERKLRCIRDAVLQKHRLTNRIVFVGEDVKGGWGQANQLRASRPEVVVLVARERDCGKRKMTNEITNGNKN